VALRGGLSQTLLRALGDAIAAFHAGAEPVRSGYGAGRMRDVIRGNEETFAACAHSDLDPGRAERLQAACRKTLDAVASLLDRREEGGLVRHCHGDLHLRNICLIDSRPVLFDCIEFSDALATIDVLYDLAFLLMDLLHRGLTAEANLVFNRYLDGTADIDGLRALPLFLAVRAAIRAHVAASDDRDQPDPDLTRSYLDLALRLIQPTPHRLVAVGGLSGTGKSTLARALAPGLGPAPGARIVRSDVIRKRLHGIRQEERLPPAAYTRDTAERVYSVMIAEAEGAVRNGHAAIVDAVFADPTERAAVRRVADEAGVPFVGLWLEAPFPVLEQRVAARRGDASDADLDVLQRQMSYDIGRIDWTRLDVAQDGALATARRILGLGAPDADPA
jgi:predicted kinase